MKSGPTLLHSEMKNLSPAVKRDKLHLLLKTAPPDIKGYFHFLTSRVGDCSLPAAENEELVCLSPFISVWDLNTRAPKNTRSAVFDRS